MSTNDYLEIGSKINPYFGSILNITELNREGRTADWNPLSWYKVEFSKRYEAKVRQLQVKLNLAFESALKEDIEKVVNIEIERAKERIDSKLKFGIIPQITARDHVFPGGSSKFVTLIYQLNENQESILYMLGKLNEK